MPALVDIWITRAGNACRVDDHDWIVEILDCDSNPFEWGSTSFSGLAAPKAHWFGNVPPGIYVIFAHAKTGGKITDCAIVAVGCDGNACVRLYVRGPHGGPPLPSGGSDGPPDHGCKIHIEDAIGILGNPNSPDATSVRVTGTAAGCKTIQVVVNCVPGKGQATVGVATGSNWQVNVPIKSGCRCGGKLHVVATCADNPNCKDEFNQPRLRCTAQH